MRSKALPIWSGGGTVGVNKSKKVSGHDALHDTKT